MFLLKFYCHYAIMVVKNCKKLIFPIHNGVMIINRISLETLYVMIRYAMSLVSNRWYSILPLNETVKRTSVSNLAEDPLLRRLFGLKDKKLNGSTQQKSHLSSGHKAPKNPYCSLSMQYLITKILLFYLQLIKKPCILWYLRIFIGGLFWNC